jgi:anti-sigma regulatory factor (Ser/Thr protein kinase)
MVTDQSEDPRAAPVLATTWLDGADDVARARRLVAAVAGGIGLHPDRVDRLTVALSEVATNAVVHGGGSATILVTGGRGQLAVEIRDQGGGGPPPSVRAPVSPTQLSGRGLWLADQLCDHVDIRASDAGTTVRLTMRL